MKVINTTKGNYNVETCYLCPCSFKTIDDEEYVCSLSYFVNKEYLDVSKNWFTGTLNENCLLDDDDKKIQ